MSGFSDLPVIDCHVHFGTFSPERIKISKEDLKKQTEFILKVTKEGRLSGIYITDADRGLYLKAKHPGLFYAGGFVPWSGMTDALPNVDWPGYIDALVEAGFDGIGEMGSKPSPKDKHTPLDGEYYRGFWEHCESISFPVLCHVADPEEFWDERLAPEWAKKQGWVYYKGDYPSKEELYMEMENVLERHPKLKVALCHFYFISSDLERADNFLDCYKNANFDITLGIELMYNISRRRDDWRDFFVKHQNRIFFGTDIATWQTLQESVTRIWMIRKFLESDEEFYTPPTADLLLTRYREPFIGLKLPIDTLRKIYAENFRRLWGNKPRIVDLEAAIKRCEENSEDAVVEALRNLP